MPLPNHYGATVREYNALKQRGLNAECLGHYGDAAECYASASILCSNLHDLVESTDDDPIFVILESKSQLTYYWAKAAKLMQHYQEKCRVREAATSD